MMMMRSLSSFSSAKLYILCSLANGSSPPSPSYPKPPVRRVNTASTVARSLPEQKQKQNQNQNQNQNRKQKQPSVAEIERVIGAGIFRDRDATDRDPEDGKSLFDSILSNSIGKSEGSAERKLRETGEWLIDRTERGSNSAGKSILKSVFLLVLPMWIFLFLVASGAVRLPFTSSILDDLIM